MYVQVYTVNSCSELKHDDLQTNMIRHHYFNLNKNRKNWLPTSHNDVVSTVQSVIEQFSRMKVSQTLANMSSRAYFTHCKSDLIWIYYYMRNGCGDGCLCVCAEKMQASHNRPVYYCNTLLLMQRALYSCECDFIRVDSIL